MRGRRGEDGGGRGVVAEEQRPVVQEVVLGRGVVFGGLVDVLEGRGEPHREKACVALVWPLEVERACLDFNA